MKTKFKLLILFIFLMTGSLNSFSQQIPDSLLRYLKTASSNNPALLQRFTEYKAALKKIPQAGSLPDPQLDMGVFITPMELIEGKQMADIKLMQMFPWFGVLKNAKDEMSLMAKARLELLRDTKLQIYYDMQRTWYELFMLRKYISISEKNIEILRVIEKLALIKYKVPSSVGTSINGSGLTDLYRIQIETGDLINNIANLRNQELVIIARFNGYLNRPPMADVYTGEILLADTLEIDLSAISDSIQENNPMLDMLNYEKEAYQARKKMVTGMGYPMVGFGLNYSVIGKSEMSTSSMNGNDMIMPMISITLPVYRKKYKTIREEADLLSKASSQNYQAALNSLNTEYYTAVQLYQDAKRRIKLYENQYTLASKSLEIMLKSFAVSSVTLTDVLRVRQQTLDYEYKQVEAITDLNTAKALLVRLMAIPENQ